MLALLLFFQALPVPVAVLAGMVVDVTGAPVASATVSLDGTDLTAATTADGRFELPVGSPPPWTLRATHAGFETATAIVSDTAAVVRFELAPAAIAETVTVTAWRGSPLAALAAAPVSIVSRDAISGGSAYSLDDALKQVPGFSLFRRSSSRVANPTAQGVTLRGLSASGASRTTVLFDGVPLNDPFGGWVAWNRVPIAAIERVEIMRGGGSDLYGSDAIAGVIQVVSADPQHTRALAQLEGGNEATRRASAFAAVSGGGWFTSIAGEVHHTAGYIPVARVFRGVVDRPAGGASRVATLTAGRQMTATTRLAIRAGAYHEARENGTPLQTNRTTARDVAAELHAVVAGGMLTARGGGGRQAFDQSFATVTLDRGREVLSRTQRIPSHHGFGSLQWTRVWGRLHLLGGAETRIVAGRTREVPFVAGLPGTSVETGGRLRVTGTFVQAAWTPGPAWSVVIGGRSDRASVTPDAGVSLSDGAFSPRASVGYRIAPAWSARATVTRAFRTPTLNERFRGFRVGNVSTVANEALRPERLSGAEASLGWNAPRGATRVTWFVNDVRDVVANVTISSTPALIVRQRQNAGRARSDGVEAEATWRPVPALTATATLSLISARLVDAPEGLTGKRVPQVAPVTGGLAVDWRPARWQVSGRWRASAGQYDDDRNEFLLARAATLDVRLDRTVGRGLDLFLAVENLFDTLVEAGRTPVLTIGQPRTARVGLRLGTSNGGRRR